jgi:hypothetical protein
MFSRFFSLDTILERELYMRFSKICKNLDNLKIKKILKMEMTLPINLANSFILIGKVKIKKIFIEYSIPRSCSFVPHVWDFCI